MKIVVAGTGYVGLVTGVCLSNMGHYVTCVDNDIEKIKMLRSGVPTIYEEGLSELMEKNQERLLFTTDYKNAYKNPDIIFIGVGTPENKDGTANLTYVYDVAEQIANSLEQNCTVVIKSTVPIGTNDKIEQYFKENSKYTINVVSNPEFLSQGSAIKDTLYASRIIVGTNNEASAKIMKKLYAPLTKEPYNVPYLNMDRNSAEMVKYASNNFLALKISFINEIANLCEKIDADIGQVSKGMGFDKRIGDKFLQAGIGFGGSCFPKDTKALYNIGKENNVELKTVKACISVNQSQRMRLLEKLNQYYKNNLKGLNVAILGLTFKANTDDIRDSASIENILVLLEAGAIIKAYDPIYKKDLTDILVSKLSNKDLVKNFSLYDTIDETIKDTDAALIFTNWDEIKNYNIEKYLLLMNNAIVIDGRNCYNINTFNNSNIKYFSIGRKPKQ